MDKLKSQLIGVILTVLAISIVVPQVAMANVNVPPPRPDNDYPLEVIIEREDSILVRGVEQYIADIRINNTTDDYLQFTFRTEVYSEVTGATLGPYVGPYMSGIPAGWSLCGHVEHPVADCSYMGFYQYRLIAYVEEDTMGYGESRVYITNSEANNHFPDCKTVFFPGMWEFYLVDPEGRYHGLDHWSGMGDGENTSTIHLFASPNPFNAKTNITFELSQQSDVKLDIYNILGRKVVTLAEGNYNAGTYNINWDASDQPSGVYFYRLSTPEEVKTQRITLMK
ncbi:MAG: T9SS type A sorting domain-containing protein [candidate division Zixibacteria bacterium]|nr:T9SS type A sorting domain-containing protein [candidate division Zixibacteria bacterium]